MTADWSSIWRKRRAKHHSAGVKIHQCEAQQGLRGNARCPRPSAAEAGRRGHVPQRLEGDLAAQPTAVFARACAIISITAQVKAANAVSLNILD